MLDTAHTIYTPHLLSEVGPEVESIWWTLSAIHLSTESLDTIDAGSTKFVYRAVSGTAAVWDKFLLPVYYHYVSTKASIERLYSRNILHHTQRSGGFAFR